MPITFRCASCQKLLKAPDGKSGGKVVCPRCQQKLQIPANAPSKTILGDLVDPGSLALPQPSRPAGPGPARSLLLSERLVHRSLLIGAGVGGALLLVFFLWWLVPSGPGKPVAQRAGAPPGKVPEQDGKPPEHLLPGARAVGGGQKSALLVGVNHYDHANLSILRYAENDAAELASLLEEEGFDVVLLTTTVGKKEAGKAPTLTNIQKHFDDLRKRCKRNDTLLVALAGHGVHFNESFFCPQDANPDEKETATLLPLKLVYERLGSCGAGVKLLLVDACRNNPRLNRGRNIDVGTLIPPGGMAVLFSCGTGEVAFEHESYRHGIFFYHILDGLRGRAQNPDWEVTWDSLVEYVKRRVPPDVRSKIGAEARQTPRQSAVEFAGTVLARIRRGPPPLAPAHAPPVGDGWQSLFNGKDLAGWERDGCAVQAWRVENGELVAVGDPINRGWLLTETSYADFILRFQFKLAASGNSGVTFRTEKGALHPEIQISDDLAPGQIGRPQIMKTGALYKIAAAQPANLEPVGSWNDMEIEVQGPALRVAVNRKEVLRTDLNNAAALAPDLPGLKNPRGRVGFQSWDQEVHFRKIDLKDLGQSQPPVIAAKPVAPRGKDVEKQLAQKIFPSLVHVRVADDNRVPLGIVTNRGICTVMPGNFQDVELVTLDGQRTVAGQVNTRQPFPFCWIDSDKLDLRPVDCAQNGARPRPQEAFLVTRLQGVTTILAGHINGSGAFSTEIELAPNQLGVVAPGPIFAADGTCLGYGLRLGLDQPIMVYQLK